jgi:hypothetical protein
MFSALRKRLHLSPATVIASVAFVFALTGGACAASKYVITSTKQIKPSVLASLKGKAGPAGPAGSAGAAGPAGGSGAAGEKGAAGSNGTNGTNGKDGVSVTSKSFAGAKGSCKAGGSEFLSSSGTTFACNGESAQSSAFLQEGATETGVVSTISLAAGGGYLPISFSIPLEGPLSSGQVHFVTQAEVTGHSAPEACKGTAAAPTAKAGNLCVYEGENGLVNTEVVEIENPALNHVLGASADGCYLVVSFKESPAWVKATWAVTG